MPYHLSYRRTLRGTVFQAIAPQSCYQGFTLDVIYVCVCVRAIASQRKGIPESTTRVCVVPGLRFAGGAGNNKPAGHLFGPLFPKGGEEIAQGGWPKKQTPAELIRATASGRGVVKTEPPRSMCQGIGGAGTGSLEYLRQHMKQRVVFIVVRACSGKYIYCSMHENLIPMEFIKGRMV